MTWCINVSNFQLKVLSILSIQKYNFVKEVRILQEVLKGIIEECYIHYW